MITNMTKPTQSTYTGEIEYIMDDNVAHYSISPHSLVPVQNQIVQNIQELIQTGKWNK